MRMNPKDEPIGTDFHWLAARLVASWDRISYDPNSNSLVAWGRVLGRDVALVAFGKPGRMGIDRAYVVDGDTYAALLLAMPVPTPSRSLWLIDAIENLPKRLRCRECGQLSHSVEDAADGLCWSCSGDQMAGILKANLAAGIFTDG